MVLQVPKSLLLAFLGSVITDVNFVSEQKIHFQVISDGKKKILASDLWFAVYETL